MNTTYHRLGDYIREVNVRNRDLKVTKPMGINIDKHFMPSVANVIGTDLSNYKMVHKKQFACNLMHVGRDEKIPMAMMTEDETIIVSPAYFVFEIIKTDMLLPEYLMMWFSRPEFDRNAWFYTDADVRGGMDKKAFMDMRLPVPTLSRQREIVAEYETLTRRIRLNEQMIAKLEETAQALYRKMFVDGVDKERLPEGWRMGKLGEVCEIKYGKAHEGIPNGLIPIYGSGGIMRYGNKSLCTKESVLIPRKGSLNNIMYINEPFWTVDTMFYTEMKQLHVAKFVYFNLKKYDFLSMDAGSAVPSMTTAILNQIELVIPPLDILEDFDKKMSIIFNNTKIKNKETNKLKELLSLLLGKIIK
ncbi:MAG: restriction endonuclease subunit S [Bacteroidales bacterium]|nr:restriction endonuclease subunit S [Bacteroidales bacterium]